MAQLPTGHVPLIRSWLQRLRKPPAPITDDLWHYAQTQTPWLQRLETERASRLRELATRFLHEKTITPLCELSLSPAQRVQLAAICCLPLLECGESGLRGWSQLLVYPDAFRVQRSHIDSAGVLHEWEDDIIGEAWDSGPLVLSWADVLADIEDPGAGFCVAVHEMAHKLDAIDGAMDGTPLLPREWQREWARDFEAEYSAFCAKADAGHETAIDPYAAEAPEEFFAVASEYHFSAPALLQTELPRVASHLQRFYGSPPSLG